MFTLVLVVGYTSKFRIFEEGMSLIFKPDLGKILRSTFFSRGVYLLPSEQLMKEYSCREGRAKELRILESFIFWPLSLQSRKFSTA